MKRYITLIAALAVVGSIGRASSQEAVSAKRITTFQEPAFQQWVKDTAALPGKQQVKAVTAKLTELNPGFQGVVLPFLHKGVVYNVNIDVDDVSDLSPLRALPGLEQLVLKGRNPAKGQLFDLSPLAGTSVATLTMFSVPASDLSPLKGTAVRYLNFYATRISDLSALQAVPLTHLSFSGKDISDLSPLRGMPLTYLACSNTDVSDLSPLDNCQALELICFRKTKVSPENAAAFHKAHPKCLLDWDEPGKAAAPELKKLDTPVDLPALFALLDKLGRSAVEHARFVELSLASAEDPAKTWKEVDVWLLEDKPDSITVLRHDLLPWTLSKTAAMNRPRRGPSHLVKLLAVNDADFEARCKALAKIKPAGFPSQGYQPPPEDFPDPAYRILLAHAAWKRGLHEYEQALIAAGPYGNDLAKDLPKFCDSVLNRLAEQQFERSTELLTYADRREVLAHLQLVIQLARNEAAAAEAQDLVQRLEKLIARPVPRPDLGDEQELNKQQLADLYVSQLPDLSCPEKMVFGHVTVYSATVDGKPDDNPATVKLRNLGAAAVPALLKALDDDTPTRTIGRTQGFDSRSFRKQLPSSLVWRVSDFAWILLQDITNKDLGVARAREQDRLDSQRNVNFVLSAMQPEQKKFHLERAKRAVADYTATVQLSEEERMLAFFDSKQQEDWVTAAKYFLQKQDKRAIPRLIEKLDQRFCIHRGQLCVLLSEFGDPSAKPAILDFARSAWQYRENLDAAIALWNLGDPSGIPDVIEQLRTENNLRTPWDETVYFLMRTRRPESMDALDWLMTRDGNLDTDHILASLVKAVEGRVGSLQKPSAGSVELCPVLISAMDRNDRLGARSSKADGLSLIMYGKGAPGAEFRIKDAAATAFVVLRDGQIGRHPRSLFPTVDPEFFDQTDPDQSKRDRQIKALKDWYADHKDQLIWDAQKQRLATKDK